MIVGILNSSRKLFLRPEFALVFCVFPLARTQWKWVDCKFVTTEFVQSNEHKDVTVHSGILSGYAFGKGRAANDPCVTKTAHLCSILRC